MSTTVREAVAAGRVDPEIENLRTHTARGTLVNSAFQIGLAGLNLLRRLAVAIFITRAEFGLWGIILAVLITLVWLKQVGVMDKYVQQSEPDQEAAFQKAFTLELGLSAAYFALCAAAMPLYALAYGHPEIIVPGLVLATSVILSALETPSWVSYRRMQYARQRTLIAVNPVISVIATIALCAAGLGVWGLVVGALIGSVAGAAVNVAASPYRLRLRFDRATFGDYVSFSWPLVGLGVSRLLVVQGSLLATNRVAGIVGVGAIGLATSFAMFSDRVDQVVSQTIYPAVCAVADRTERMAEVFVKSNRVALMWAMPFAVGLALFAGDLIHFVLGDKWESAIGLLAVIGLACGFGQVAFNWTVFMRAVNRTRPLFAASLLELGAFFVVALPLTLKFGVAGYAAGFAVSTVIQVAARAYYLRSLFPHFNVVRQTLRAVAPPLPAAGLVLALRAVGGGDRTPARAAAELALFCAVAAASTYLFERRLIGELFGYVRGRVAPAAVPEAGSLGTG